MSVLTTDEVNVLKGVHKGMSLQEIADTIGKTVGWIHRIARDMESRGLIVQPKARIARGRKLSEDGVKYLEANGLMKDGQIVGDVGDPIPEELKAEIEEKEPQPLWPAQELPKPQPVYKTDL